MTGAAEPSPREPPPPADVAAKPAVDLDVLRTMVAALKGVGIEKDKLDKVLAGELDDVVDGMVADERRRQLGGDDS